VLASLAMRVQTSEEVLIFSFVMPGLDPGIHPAVLQIQKRFMDCRVKPGNDD
jgi:hypothetical protein